jgi:hypothetical protein
VLTLKKKEKNMLRTRKVTVTFLCLAEDVNHVKKSLADHPNSEGWFYDSDVPLKNIDIKVEEPTPEEDAKALEDWDDATLHESE